MILEPDVLRSERTHVDQAEEIRLSWLNGDSQVLSVVEQCGLRYGLRAGRIGDVDEFVQEIVHEIVVPIGKCYDDFFVIEIFEWVFEIMHNERATKTIWILAALMAVVPICAGLVDLVRLKTAMTVYQRLRNSR